MPSKEMPFRGRITINQTGSNTQKQNTPTRKIISISERLNGNTPGSVYLSFPTVAMIHNGSGSERRFGLPVDSDIVKNRKISVHPSLHSEQTNLIHETLDYEYGRKPEEFHYHTSALKVQNRFAPIMVKRCSLMVDPPSDVKGRRHNDFNIGLYNTDHFTLFYGIFVGSKYRNFEIQDRHLDLNIHQFKTKYFNFVLIWSFLSIQSYRIALPISFGSKQEIDKDGQHIHTPVQGYDEAECIRLFREQRYVGSVDLIRDLRRDPNIPTSMAQIEFEDAVFYRFGRGEIDLRYLQSKLYRRNLDNWPSLRIIKDFNEINGNIL